MPIFAVINRELDALSQSLPCVMTVEGEVRISFDGGKSWKPLASPSLLPNRIALIHVGSGGAFTLSAPNSPLRKVTAKLKTFDFVDPPVPAGISVRAAGSLPLVMLAGQGDTQSWIGSQEWYRFLDSIATLH